MQESENTIPEKHDDLKKYREESGLATRWLKEINNVKNARKQKAFERNGEKIVKKYKNDNILQAFQVQNLPNTRVMFNVLWSNIQVLKPCLYARMPKPVVERRFKDLDLVGRLAAQGAERAITSMLSSQQDRFNYAIKAAVEDRLLPGRGQVWLRYDAEFEEQVDEQGEPIIQNGEAVKVLKPNSEMVWVDPVYWQDYLESIARNPHETRWRARRLWMSRSKLIKEFGEEIGKAVDLYDDKKRSGALDDDAEFFKEAEVWLIADDESKRFLWVSEGYKDAPLKVSDDVLKIQNFFPCPIPLLATTATDSSYPTPDFIIYERLADELDYVTKRISGMTECIRYIGIHAASLDKEIKNILKLADGQTWPIQNWAAFTNEKAGLGGAFSWFPFEKCVDALAPLINYQQQLLGQIFEITGIPDIVRGHSDPNETASAQQRKSKWTVIKLQEKQADVQRFCREAISKMAEIMFEPGLFTDETLSLLAGVPQMSMEDQQMWPQSLQLLRDDRLRTFRVDIETDSTIAIDEMEETQRWMEYMTSIQKIVSEIQGISQFRPELMYPIIETAKAAVRSFRTGRSVENCWEKALQEIEDADKAAKENPAPPPPDYETMKIQNDQGKIQVMQFEAQIKQQEAQFAQWFKPQELQAKNQSDQMNFELESQKLQIQAMQVQSRAQVDAMAAELDRFKTNFDQFVQTQTLELEKYRVVLDEKEKFLEEARLNQEQQVIRAESMQPREKTQPISINVNGSDVSHGKPKRKMVKVSRTPEGHLVGESIEVQDEDEAPKPKRKAKREMVRVQRTPEGHLVGESMEINDREEQGAEA